MPLVKTWTRVVASNGRCKCTLGECLVGRNNQHILIPRETGRVPRRFSASGQSSGQEKKKWYRFWPIDPEWKIIGTAAFAIASWYINAWQDRVHSKKRLEMELVSRQLKELYGPLYGNRIVAEKSYRAVVKRYGGLRNYLEQAESTRDADMIRRWRSYVWTVLYPLDKEALELICTKAHLISNTQFPEEFDRFLIHAAEMQFVMELWKNEKGLLETTKEFGEEDFLEESNSSGLGGSSSMIKHLREKCTELRLRQRNYIEDISVDNFTLGMITKFNNK